MKTLLKNFAKDQSGAVTVDYVMLASGVVFLGVVAAMNVSVGIETTGMSISERVAASTEALKDANNNGLQ